jgi:hypothetical protein
MDLVTLRNQQMNRLTNDLEKKSLDALKKKNDLHFLS